RRSPWQFSRHRCRGPSLRPHAEWSRLRMTKHIIIGGGPAAINAVETIRDIDSGASSITLVCDEPAYSRMVLPYFLANRIPRQQVFTGDDDYFQRLKVDRVTGRVTKI